MGRIHLFEFHDLGWFPEAFRDYLTDVLGLFDQLCRPFRVLCPRVEEIMEATGQRTIVDLCAGTGAPAITLLDSVDEAFEEPISVVLTDKYPNVVALERTCRSAASARFLAESVDAMDVPADLVGFRTLFNSFHHFRPEEARIILDDARRKRQPIGILERLTAASARSRAGWGWSRGARAAGPAWV